MRECVIFDLDGTFAFLGDRSPYDASRAEHDEVNQAVHFVYEAIRRWESPRPPCSWYRDVRTAGGRKRSAGWSGTGSPPMVSSCGGPETAARTRW